MSFLISRPSFVFLFFPLAASKRNFRNASRFSSKSALSSISVFSLKFLIFMLFPAHYPGFNRKFCAGFFHRFGRQDSGNSVYLKKNSAGLYRNNKTARVALSSAHCHFRRPAGYGLIRKYPDPNPPAFLHIAAQNLAAGLNLLAANPFFFLC